MIWKLITPNFCTLHPMKIRDFQPISIFMAQVKHSESYAQLKVESQVLGAEQQPGTNIGSRGSEQQDAQPRPQASHQFCLKIKP